MCKLTFRRESVTMVSQQHKPTQFTWLSHSEWLAAERDVLTRSVVGYKATGSWLASQGPGLIKLLQLISQSPVSPPTYLLRSIVPPSWLQAVFITQLANYTVGSQNCQPSKLSEAMVKIVIFKFLKTQARDDCA